MRRIWSTWRALGLALCGPGLLACSEAPEPVTASDAAAARPDVILIVIDTLRADHLGAYGYARDTSPNIDALAARGVTFTRAFAPSAWTRPSVGSLFTSLYPSEHGAVSAQHPLASGVASLAEIFARAGYRTVGVSGNFPHVNEKTGFSRGFEEWLSIGIRIPDEEAEWIGHGESWWGGVRRLRAPTAREVNAEVMKRLRSAQKRPLFLYVHYMDPHSGYLPEAPWRGRFVRDPELDARAPRATSDYVIALASGRVRVGPGERRRLIDLYDAEIATVDAAVGELMAGLAARGFEGPQVVALVSDHGEEFLDHGSWFHGLTLYEEILRVPLILWDSRQTAGGIRRGEPVDLLDVPTTLLALAGLEAAPDMRGRALLAAGTDLPERDLLAELHPDSLLEGAVRPRSHDWAFTRWPWKLIASPQRTQETFRKDRDRRERHPVERPPDDLVTRARNLRGSLPEAAPAGPELDAEDREALRALGYAD